MKYTATVTYELEIDSSNEENAKLLAIQTIPIYTNDYVSGSDGIGVAKYVKTVSVDLNGPILAT